MLVLVTFKLLVMEATILKRYDKNGAWTHDFMVLEGYPTVYPSSMFIWYLKADFELCDTDGVEYETWRDSESGLSFTIQIERISDSPELDIYRDFTTAVVH